MESLATLEKWLRRHLRVTATVYIYSKPNFILEIVLALFVAAIYLYLHHQVNLVRKKTLWLKPNAIYCEKDAMSVSKGSTSTRVTRYREVLAVTDNSSTTIAYKRHEKSFTTTSNSQYGWVLSSSQEGSLVDKRREQLVSLTPQQFVKIDRERKLREKELESYMVSLSTLCKNVLNRKYSARTLNKQVELARESLECNKMSLEGKYLGFKTEAMTKSLFNMLEQMIAGSSVQNPLPFKGDITTLALDVADLNMESFREGAKWNSSSCILGDTDESDSKCEEKKLNWKCY